MYNLIISLGIGAAAFFALWLPGLLRAYEAGLPALIVAGVAYFLLARRVFKKLEAVVTQAATFLQKPPPKFDQAIALIKQGYALRPWQFGVAAQIDSQIGMIHFIKKDFEDALPYLRRALSWGHWMSGAMLAVLYYKLKRPDDMQNAFEIVVKKGGKETLPWNLYAYCVNQLGQRDQAMAILARGMKKIKDNDKLQQNLQQLQNNKKMKMRQLYAEQWYQFHLERPPMQMADSPFSGSRNRHRYLA